MCCIIPYSRGSAFESALISRNTVFRAGAILTLLLSTLNPQLSTVFAQGSLTPPGAPAPTMKTLSQVEPRIPISAVPLTITNSGSYYLTTNLSAEGGITIDASGVSLDLNGFTLSGGGAAGINVTSLRHGIFIFNGTVRDGQDGIFASNAAYSRFEKLRVFNNFTSGILTGAGCEVTDCLVYSNYFSAGIQVGDGSSVQSCNANGNFAGIQLGSNCTAESNNCRFNSGGSGIQTFGTGNRIEGNHVSGNATGIYAAAPSSTNNLIIRNVSRANTQNYSVQPNNVMGPVINGSGGLTLTTNNPWLNFSL